MFVVFRIGTANIVLIHSCAKQKRPKNAKPRYFSHSITKKLPRDNLPRVTFCIFATLSTQPLFCGMGEYLKTDDEQRKVQDIVHLLGQHLPVAGCPGGDAAAG
jgi:hypothetical protein